MTPNNYHWRKTKAIYSNSEISLKLIREPKVLATNP